MAAVGHGLSRSAILVLLVLLFQSLGVINDLGPCLSLGGTVQSAFVPGRFSMFPGNVFFLAHSSQAQQTGTNIVYSTHKGLDSLDFQLLFIGQVWNALRRISVSSVKCQVSRLRGANALAHIIPIAPQHSIAYLKGTWCLN